LIPDIDVNATPVGAAEGCDLLIYVSWWHIAIKESRKQAEALTSSPATLWAFSIWEQLHELRQNHPDPADFR
jgi:hypothetical protein